ncbi:MAG: ribosomal RNA small subunit methyltransferase A [Candidatus Solibacter usitatus]|nr:ribosomal RNA small subunit methyltransferase A [Candidatus Solibacter usitatus]
MARQRLGQHFLTQGRILERIAQAACPAREPLVLEIGAGTGALTARLLTRADRVVAIELDEGLAAGLRQRYSPLTVMVADAREMDLGRWGPAVIAGNLPYYAATQIIERALASPLTRGVFLIQKEVAERLCASPGSRDYGYLTVATQLLADVELLFGVPPSAFRPPPKVESAVVRLTPRAKAEALGIADVPRFLEFASRCFRQKRKTLRNNLAAFYPGIDSLPESARRAEQLTLAQFAALYLRLAG